MSTVTPDQLAVALEEAGIYSDTAATMIAIAWRESRWMTDAVGHNANGSTDRGLWQINSTWVPALEIAHIISTPDDLLKAGPNLYAAKYVLDHQGLQAWAYQGHTPPDGLDPAILAQARAAVKKTATGAAGITSDAHIGLSDLLSIPGASAQALTSNAANPVGSIAETLGGLGALNIPGAVTGALGLSGLAEQILSVFLETVFTGVALGLILLGVSRLSGMTPQKATEAAGQVATVAALV